MSLFSRQDGDYHDQPTYEITEQQPYGSNSIEDLPRAQYWIVTTDPTPAPVIPSMAYNPYQIMIPPMTYMDPSGQPAPSYMPTYPYNPPLTTPGIANLPMQAPLLGPPPAAPQPVPYYPPPQSYPSYYPSYPPPAPAYHPPPSYYPQAAPNYSMYPWDDHYLPP
jgi:hypothetical protein